MDYSNKTLFKTIVGTFHSAFFSSIPIDKVNKNIIYLNICLSPFRLLPLSKDKKVKKKMRGKGETYKGGIIHKG